MNTLKKLFIITSITGIILLGFAIGNYITPGVNANIIFDEQGRVIHVDGEHNKTYALYDKNGNYIGTIWAADACALYKTTDVAEAIRKTEAATGYIAVPYGEDPTAYVNAKKNESATNNNKETFKDETGAETVTNAEKETPKHNHGIYDDITDEALLAFDYFTHDGVADSCYIQIKEDAEQRTMLGEYISKTAANSEYGEVQFVNENEEVVYKFVFPQVKADADFAMELTPTIEDVDEGIKVDFKDEKLYNMDLGFEVDFFFQTGKPGTKFYVYTSEADGLHEYNTITTDADGFARLPYTMVQDYTFSETDLVAAAEEAKAKAQAEAEAKKLEEEANKATEDQVSTPAEEIVTEEEPIEPVITGKSSVTPYVLVGVVALTLVVVGIVVARRFIK